MWLVPWALYFGGLGGINGRPSYAENVPTIENVQALWKEFRINEPPEFKKLTPHGYILMFFRGEIDSSSAFAWHIAKHYNLHNLKYKGNSWWHFSGAALTIWISRNWTEEQIVARAVEIYITKANPTLQPTLNCVAPSHSVSGR